jgi:hypothetical protein
MDPREKADRSADALMAAATAEQQQAAERNTRELVRMYPGLAKVPPMERHAALARARELVDQSRFSKLSLAVVTLILAAAVALAVTGHRGIAVVTGAGAMLAAIGRQFVVLSLLRRQLRVDVESG